MTWQDVVATLHRFGGVNLYNGCFLTQRKMPRGIVSVWHDGTPLDIRAHRCDVYGREIASTGRVAIRDAIVYTSVVEMKLGTFVVSRVLTDALTWNYYVNEASLVGLDALIAADAFDGDDVAVAALTDRLAEVLS